MSDYEVVEAEEVQEIFRVRHYRSRKEPHAEFKDGHLYIIIFSEDLKDIYLTSEEILKCKQEEDRLHLQLEYCNSRAVLQKAGRQKY